MVDLNLARTDREWENGKGSELAAISVFSSNIQRTFVLSLFQKSVYSYKYTKSYLFLCHKQ